MKNVFRKSIGILLTVAMLAGLMSFTALADEPLFVGSGTEADPYLISTPLDLVNLAEATNKPAADTEYEDKYYKLTNNIDMGSTTDFYGIARKEKITDNGDGTTTYGYTGSNCGFSGTIDGDGYIISNLTVDRSRNTGANPNAALVVWASGNAAIKNLGITSAKMTVANETNSGTTSAAAFVSAGKVRIENCFVRGITFAGSPDKKASFIGRVQDNSVLENCYNKTSGLALTNNYSTSGNIVTFRNVYLNNNLGSAGKHLRYNLYSYSSDKCYNYNESDATTTTTSDFTFAQFLTAAGSAFETDKYVQNGEVPVLAWENKFDTKIYKNNQVTLTNRTNTTVEGIIIVAGYKNDNEMVDVAVLKDSEDNEVYALELAGSTQKIYTYEPVQGATYHKAFVWDGTTNLVPLCLPATTE